MGKLEARQAQIKTYAMNEQKLFNIERAIWNYHNPGKRISEDAKLIVDFVEPTFPLSPDEKVKDAEYRLKHNISTEIDLIMENNPDLEKDEAIKLYQQNKIFNGANKPIVTLAPVMQPGTQEPEEEEEPEEVEEA